MDEYGDDEGVVFLAISTDAQPTDVVPRFMGDNDYDFVVLYDEASAADFEVPGVPAGFIIGVDGLIKYRTSGFPGAETYLREMRLRIDALRAQQRP